MGQQEVTLSVPKELLRQVRALAAARKQSLSELLRKVLEEKIGSDAAYQVARRRQLVMLRQGFDLGTKGKIMITRADMHDR